MQNQGVHDLEEHATGGEEVDAEKDLSAALLLQLAVLDEHDESDQRYDVPLKVLRRPQTLQHLLARFRHDLLLPATPGPPCHTRAHTLPTRQILRPEASAGSPMPEVPCFSAP
jgi:hypothetical protein